MSMVLLSGERWEVAGRGTVLGATLLSGDAVDLIGQEFDGMVCTSVEFTRESANIGIVCGRNAKREDEGG